MLRVRVLGRLALERDGRRVDLPAGRPRELVAYLALHPGAHPRGLVAAQLWADGDTEPGRQRLRTALWQVRRALAGVDQPLVDATREAVGLSRAVAVDRLEARELLDDGAIEAAVRLLEPGLAEELDQAWADQARREVHAWRLEGLAATSNARVSTTAVAHARRRVELDPLSEGAHGDLIRLLAESGDRAAAMAAYEGMRQLLESELGIGPSTSSRRLLAQVAGGNVPPPSAPPLPRRRVPLSATPLLGRDADLGDLDAGLRAHRLVTVVGPGGVGKTRVAFAVAEQAADAGRSVSVAELATTRSADACDFVVAAALEVHAGPGRALRDAMVDRLELEPGLLVLDNCEHVLGAVRDVLAHLLRWSASTTVLATSREPLGLPGEHVLRLQPLPAPQEGDSETAILASPAVQLLASAARRGQSRAMLPSSDSGGLARLARRLDGLPLALELAAARIPSLGVAQLDERLTAGLDVLSDGRSGARGRQDSLLDTLEWSMTLLSPHERRLLGLLSSLPGRFPLAAVEAMVGAARVSTDPVVGLARLVDASLVQAHPEEVWSYSTLETIRIFGRRLLDDGTQAAARRGLVRWAGSFADDVRRREVTDEARVHTEAVLFLPLLRAALHAAREDGDVDSQRRIITGVEGWATWREQPEVWQWVRELATREPAEHADADLLRMGAVAAWRMGQVPLMGELTGRCVAADPGGPAGPAATAALMLLAFAERRWADAAELAATVGEVGGPDRTVALTLAAAALARCGRPRSAAEAALAARRDADRLGAPTMRALALLGQARAAMPAKALPAVETARARLAEARDLAGSVGSMDLVASIDKQQGILALRHQPEQAVEPLRRACLYWLGTGNREPLAKALTALGDALAATGRPEVAGRIADAARSGELTAQQLAGLVPAGDPPSWG